MPTKQIANPVELRCPKCRKRQIVERDALDPADTARVDVQCPECNGGDFDTPRYFRADGSELQWNE